MLGALCLGAGVLAEAERLTVKEQARPYDLFLPEEVEQTVSAKRFVAFRSGRGLWVELPGRPLRPLGDIVNLPSGFDWYQHACAAGDRLVVSVSRYDEEQRLREERSDPGEFREGPAPAGYLVVDFRKPRVTYLKSLTVTARPFGEGEEEVTLGMQSCLWDGRRLYVGDYGARARVDLEAGSVEILEEDEFGDLGDGSGLLRVAGPWSQRPAE